MPELKFEEKYIMTLSERKVYLFIKNFIAENGYSPTLNDIARGCITSKSWVHQVISQLHERGYVNYVPKKVRTITIAK